MLDEIILEIDEGKWKHHPRVIAARKKRDVPEHGIITSELIERRNYRRNKPFIPRRIYFNAEATRDGIRHFVDGMGDTNPLFRSEEYAKNTKYHQIIAPGTYLYTHQFASQAGGFPGIHGWYVGGDWEWFRPILVGTKLSSVIIVRDLVIKRGRMTGGGKIYIDYGETIYLNVESGEPLGRELVHTVRAERGGAGSAKKEFGKPKPVYTRDDWRKILELYNREEIRGSAKRYWEEVQIGESLGPMIKGPLSVRDEIAWLMGAGSPFFKAHKIELVDFESRHPRALEYIEETGEADVPELVHILDRFARQIGVERPYDYGSQRMSWLCNLFTNWMGDDGFLWKMSGDLRVFNQMGDITFYEGKVTRKYIDDSKCCVEIEAWAKNQRGEWSMTPHISTIILPSKEYGPVKYPNPTSELLEEISRARPLDDMIEEGLI